MKKNNKDNKFTKMQKGFYNEGTSNHHEHNENIDYWNILLADLKESKKWKGKNALDFGSGMGRNVSNMINLCDWNRVDGIDISQGNIEQCKKLYAKQKSNWYCNNGVDLSELKSEDYDFAMSTITFQHIPVHEIRFNLLTEIYRVLKPKAVLSIQIPFGPSEGAKALYFDNHYDASGTNSAHDFRATSTDDIKSDFSKIGYKNITFKIRESFSDNQHPKWVYIRSEK